MRIGTQQSHRPKAKESQSRLPTLGAKAGPGHEISDDRTTGSSRPRELMVEMATGKVGISALASDGQGVIRAADPEPKAPTPRPTAGPCRDYAAFPSEERRLDSRPFCSRPPRDRLSSRCLGSEIDRAQDASAQDA